MPVSDEFKDVSAATVNALEQAGYDVWRFGDKSSLDSGDYWQSQLLEALSSADVVVADVTGPRPNVLYEIGYAHGQRKPVILMGQPDSLKTLPGYLRNYQILIYEPHDFEELTYLIRRSVERLTSSMAS
jgi:ABC-type branched-subunit amino acid transport system substrate-binding protein